MTRHLIDRRREILAMDPDRPFGRETLKEAVYQIAIPDHATHDDRLDVVEGCACDSLA